MDNQRNWGRPSIGADGFHGRPQASQPRGTFELSQLANNAVNSRNILAGLQQQGPRMNPGADKGRIDMFDFSTPRSSVSQPIDKFRAPNSGTIAQSGSMPWGGGDSRSVPGNVPQGIGQFAYGDLSNRDLSSMSTRNSLQMIGLQYEDKKAPDLDRIMGRSESSRMPFSGNTALGGNNTHFSSPAALSQSLFPIMSPEDSLNITADTGVLKSILKKSQQLGELQLGKVFSSVVDPYVVPSGRSEGMSSQQFKVPGMADTIMNVDDEEEFLYGKPETKRPNIQQPSCDVDLSRRRSNESLRSTSRDSVRSHSSDSKISHSETQRSYSESQRGHNESERSHNESQRSYSESLRSRSDSRRDHSDSQRSHQSDFHKGPRNRQDIGDDYEYERSHSSRTRARSQSPEKVYGRSFKEHSRSKNTDDIFKEKDSRPQQSKYSDKEFSTDYKTQRSQGNASDFRDEGKLQYKEVPRSAAYDALGRYMDTSADKKKTMDTRSKDLPPANFNDLAGGVDPSKDPTIANILESIGFDFEMSKRMQERAKQVQGGPQKTAKGRKSEDSQFGIDMSASFLGEGINKIPSNIFNKSGQPKTKIQPIKMHVRSTNVTTSIKIPATVTHTVSSSGGSPKSAHIPSIGYQPHHSSIPTIDTFHSNSAIQTQANSSHNTSLQSQNLTTIPIQSQPISPNVNPPANIYQVPMSSMMPTEPMSPMLMPRNVQPPVEYPGRSTYPQHSLYPTKGLPGVPGVTPPVRAPWHPASFRPPMQSSAAMSRLHSQHGNTFISEEELEAQTKEFLERTNRPPASKRSVLVSVQCSDTNSEVSQSKSVLKEKDSGKIEARKVISTKHDRKKIISSKVADKKSISSKRIEKKERLDQFGEKNIIADKVVEKKVISERSESKKRARLLKRAAELIDSTKKNFVKKLTENPVKERVTKASLVKTRDEKREVLKSLEGQLYRLKSIQSMLVRKRKLHPNFVDKQNRLQSVASDIKAAKLEYDRISQIVRDATASLNSMERKETITSDTNKSPAHIGRESSNRSFTRSPNRDKQWQTSRRRSRDRSISRSPHRDDMRSSVDGRRSNDSRQSYDRSSTRSPHTEWHREVRIVSPSRGRSLEKLKKHAPSRGHSREKSPPRTHAKTRTSSDERSLRTDKHPVQKAGEKRSFNQKEAATSSSFKSQLVVTKAAIRVKKRKLEDSDVEKKENIHYEYTDPGNHFCLSCKASASNIYELFNHLHTKHHKQKQDPYDRPWMTEELKTPVKPTGTSCKVLPMKGEEFFMPISGFYCSLCSVFSGDAMCGENHLKSQNHNENYMKYIKENPFYERRRKLDRAAASENPGLMSELKSKPAPGQHLDDKTIVIDPDVDSKTVGKQTTATSVSKPPESDTDDVMIIDYTAPTNDPTLKPVKRLDQQRETQKRRKARLAEAKKESAVQKGSNLAIVSEHKGSTGVLSVEAEKNVSTTVTNVKGVKEVNKDSSNVDSTAKISSYASHSGKGANITSMGVEDKSPGEVLKMKPPFSPLKSPDVTSSNSAPNAKPTIVKPHASVPDVKSQVTKATLQVPNVQTTGNKQDVNITKKSPDVKISGLSGKDITGEKITVKVSDMKQPSKFAATRLTAKSVIVPVVKNPLSDCVVSKPSSFPIVSLPSVTKYVCDPISNKPARNVPFPMATEISSESANIGSKIEPNSTVLSLNDKPQSKVPFPYQKKRNTEDISNNKSVETSESKTTGKDEKPENHSVLMDVASDDLGEDMPFRMEVVWPSEAETPYFADDSAKKVIKSDRGIPVQATQSKSVPFSVKTEIISDQSKSVPFPVKKELQSDRQSPVQTVQSKSVPFSVKTETISDQPKSVPFPVKKELQSDRQSPVHTAQTKYVPFSVKTKMDSDQEKSDQVAQSKSVPFPVKKEMQPDRQSPVQSSSVSFPVNKTAKSTKPEVKKIKSPVKRKVPFPVKRDTNKEKVIPFPVAKTVPFPAKKEKVVPFPVAKTVPFPIENKDQPTPEETNASVAVEDPYSDIDDDSVSDGSGISMYMGSDFEVVDDLDDEIGDVTME